MCRQIEAELEHERMLNEMVGAAYRKAEQERKEAKGRGAVIAFLKAFVRERRSDFSAEAIVEATDNHLSLEFVTEVLAELKASGEYDRILAEPVPTDADIEQFWKGGG